GMVVVEAEEVAEAAEIRRARPDSPRQAYPAKLDEVPVILDRFPPAVEVGRREARPGLPHRPPAPAIGSRQRALEKGDAVEAARQTAELGRCRPQALLGVAHRRGATVRRLGLAIE